MNHHHYINLNPTILTKRERFLLVVWSKELNGKVTEIELKVLR